MDSARDLKRVVRFVVSSVRIPSLVWRVRLRIAHVVWTMSVFGSGEIVSA